MAEHEGKDKRGIAEIIGTVIAGLLAFAVGGYAVREASRSGHETAVVVVLAIAGFLYLLWLSRRFIKDHNSNADAEPAAPKPADHWLGRSAPSAPQPPAQNTERAAPRSFLWWWLVLSGACQALTVALLLVLVLGTQRVSIRETVYVTGGVTVHQDSFTRPLNVRIVDR